MNNFNAVHSAIRKKCVQPNVPYTDCLNCIETELDVAYHEHIDFYLSFLEDLGLIVYDTQRKVIIITERGRSTEQIFKE